MLTAPQRNISVEGPLVVTWPQNHPRVQQPMSTEAWAALWLQGQASLSRHRLSVPAAESTMAQQPWTPRPVGWRPACARGQCGLGSCPLTCTCTDQAERSRPADRDGAVRPQRAAHSGPARTDADQSGRGCARLSAQVGFASASRGRPRGSFLVPRFPEDCIVGVA